MCPLIQLRQSITIIISHCNLEWSADYLCENSAAAFFQLTALKRGRVWLTMAGKGNFVMRSLTVATMLAVRTE